MGARDRAVRGRTRVEHIGIYEIKDLAPAREAIGDAPNYHLGLTRTDRSKKLAFNTVRMMVDLFGKPLTLDSSRTSGATSPDVFVYAFRRDDGHQLVAAWAKSADRTIDISVSGPATRAIEHHLDGSAAPYPIFARRTVSTVALHPGTARLFELIP